MSFKKLEGSGRELSCQEVFSYYRKAIAYCKRKKLVAGSSEKNFLTLDHII